MIEMKGLTGKITGVDIGDVVKLMSHNDNQSPIVGYVHCIEPEYITLAPFNPYLDFTNCNSGQRPIATRYYLPAFDKFKVIERRITPEQAPKEV